MKKLQAYKFELMPVGAQVRSMSKFAGNARKVWNLALAKQQVNHAEGLKHASAIGMCYWIPEMKAEFAYLKDSPAQTLQCVVDNLNKGYQNFFAKRGDFPVFKKKGKSADSFKFPQGFKIEQGNSRIFLPKLGWIRYRNSREILGLAKNIIVSRSGSKWFASIQTEIEVEQPVHQSASIVGIDVGITRFATLSDGSYVEPLSAFKKHQTRLARYQRVMARKVKFSQNWKKAKAKITKLHQKIACARRDFLHQSSTSISKTHAMIVIEDLKVSNMVLRVKKPATGTPPRPGMSKSAAGTIAAPSRSVKAKSGLNRSILDQGWGEFRRQLEYKQLWRGGDVLAINPRNTSRTCPACGYISADNRLTQSKFECVECGYENNADHVGALNILAAGHAALACGDMMLSGHSVKQESAEMTKLELALV
jgi:putative transposase